MNITHNRISRHPSPSDAISRLAITLALALAGVCAVPASAQKLVGHTLRPSAADPAVKQFDDPNIAITGAALPADAPLAVFLSGTGGKPANAMPLMQVVAAQGYRVLGLSYDDEPAVVQVCTRDPDPACAGDFREMRTTGTGASKQVSNPPAEAIVPRLVAALRKLDKDYPAEGWGRYLDGAGPRWDGIALSGLSQGAGMAAYLARQHKVRRVVLFSSPWETAGLGPQRRPAPWIAGTGVTPAARWFAAYNQREKTVPLIRAAYAALAIPPANIIVFDLDLPAGMKANGPNPYHPIGIRDLRYVPKWQILYGRGTDPAGD